MKESKRWGNLLLWTLVLLFVLEAPAQAASETASKETAQSVAEVNKDGLVDQSKNKDDYTKGVWLHVVTGNFQGAYSNQASVWVDFQSGTRRLPEETDMKKYEPKRTNGEFAGWYTRAPYEVQEPEGDSGEYSVWHTKRKNGDQIGAGEDVPNDIQVLYAVFNDKRETEEADKLVTFYLDWNGINGRYGKCLTCTRSYNSGSARFTADDAAILGLNYRAAYDKKFENADETEKWPILQEIWEKEEFNGYTFLGWSTKRRGMSELITEDLTVQNGMYIYAQWRKGDLTSEDFEPGEDPDAGPLESVRIDGSGLNTNLSVSRHARENECVTLSMLRFPIHAQVKAITWNLTISKNRSETETVTVKKDHTYNDGSLQATAEGSALTIKNIDKSGAEYRVIVGVTAEGSGESSSPIAAPANASVGFFHTWDKGNTIKEANCTEAGRVTYTCTTCGAEKEETVGPLNHVYEKSREQYWDMIKKPTCTTAGEKQLICIRCKETNGPKVTIPALGHAWGEQTAAPVSCNENMVTKICQRDGCTARETSLVPASNPALHMWTVTNRYPDTCMSNIVYEKCQVCGETKQSTASEKKVTSAGSKAMNTSNSAIRTGWQTIHKKRYYFDLKGAMQKNGIRTIGGKKYYFDKNGVMKTGWQTIHKKKYYFNAKGVMQTNGMKTIKGKKYYFDKNGVRKTGWQKIKGKKYYFGRNGVRKTGRQKIGGRIFTFKSNGVLVG